MHFEARSHYSGNLGREMSFNKYGHAGKPIVVFPSSGGSHNEYGDFEMIRACRWYIEQGLVQFYTISSIDSESWLAEGKSPHDMAKAHEAYDRYVIHELVPLVRHESEWGMGIGVTGCSMGAYHAMNFGLRHPDVFDLVISLSGVYDARFFTGDYGNDMLVYQNSPIDYLWNMEDHWFLKRYRQNDFIACVGQGDWEAPHIADTKRLQEAFAAKAIPGWFDYWGHDVPHDWPAWRDQMPYFLGVLNQQGII